MALNPTERCPVAADGTGLDVKISPEMMQPILREIWQDRIVDQPRFADELDISPLDGSMYLDISTLMNNLQWGQEVNVPIRNRVDISQLTKKTDISTYTPVGACHSQIVIPCTFDCLSSAPTFTSAKFKFSDMYQIGVQWCMIQEPFMATGEYMRRVEESVRGYKLVLGISLWNDLMCQAIANPSNTLNAKYAECVPTHLWEVPCCTPDPTTGVLGVTNIVPIMNFVTNYLNSTLPGDWEIFSSTDFKNDWQAYFTSQKLSSVVPRTDEFLATMHQALPETMAGFVDYTATTPYINKPVHMIKDIPYFYSLSTGDTPALQSLNPFVSADGANYYVLFMRRGAFAHYERLIWSHEYQPSVCGETTQSWQQIYIGGSKLLFSEDVFVIELCRQDCIDTCI